jgi:hypothetical protein
MYGTNQFKAWQSCPAATRTATITGTGLSCKGHTHALVIATWGTVTGTSPTLDVKLQSSTTVGGTYADITGAALTQITATPNPTTSVQLGVVELNKHDEFIRAVGTIAGTSPSFGALTVTIVPFNPEQTAYAYAAGTGINKLNFNV